MYSMISAWISSIDLLAVLIILGARLGRDGEALRNRKTDLGHLGKVRAFTSEELTHRCVSLGKEIDILLCHLKNLRK